MAGVLTTGSKVECGHSGGVKLTGNDKLKVSGNAVVTTVGPTVDAKCTTQNSNSTKKCTSVSPVGGQASKLKVGGSPAMLDTVSGTSDGNPTGTMSVSVQQSKLTAS